jgi:hypothetical protein
MTKLKKYTAELLLLNLVSKISTNHDLLREFLFVYLGEDYNLFIRQFANTLSLLSTSSNCQVFE